MAEDFRDLPDLAVEQRKLHLGGVALEGVHVGDGFRIERGKTRNLFLDDRIGTPGLPGEGDDQRRFELVEIIAPDAQRIDDHALLRKEFDVIQPAEGSGVLILASAGEAEIELFQSGTPDGPPRRGQVEAEARFGKPR